MEIIEQLISISGKIWRYLLSLGLGGMILWLIKFRIDRNRAKEPALIKEIYEPLFNELNTLKDGVAKGDRIPNIKYFMDFKKSAHDDKLSKTVKKLFIEFYEKLDWYRQNSQLVSEEVDKIVKATKKEFVAGKYVQNAAPKTILVNWLDIVTKSRSDGYDDAQNIDVQLHVPGTISNEEKKFYRDNIKNSMNKVITALKANLMSNNIVSTFLREQKILLEMTVELIAECKRRKINPFTYLEMLCEG